MHLACRWMSASLLMGLLLARPAAAADLPAALDGSDAQAQAVLEKAGVASADAALKVAELDEAEKAELAKSDAEQKGGDAVITIAVVAALVALVYLYFKHVEAMNR